MIHRRNLMIGLGFGVAAAASGGAFAAPSGIMQRIAELERKNGGRLGVGVRNTTTGEVWGHRLDERFAMCSTFKALLAAQVLSRVDTGKESLSRRIQIRKADLVTHSPAVEKRVGGTMSVAELCQATVTLSDNAAANLLMRDSGGPAGLTAFVRSTGDGVTRMDRTEPELNVVIGGDQRDTTSPAAMAATLNRLVLGNALSAKSREQLKTWLIANTTGGARIRAGVPDNWVVGDKTGTWTGGATNDVAVLWPPKGGPIILTVFYDGSDATLDVRNSVIASAARIVASVYSG
ncbi:class A beta-lactamase [Caulobacter segnis]|uniref:class A beta-lactamase n=1 Tax=Caulobacter segnis TaxID=88688 RepID=UPI00240F1453|nr:class A beta-lactamase [Caulobacter segnis]MDG2521801.1 class A beta-lactamase [Caulobacter segnis]